MSVDQERTIAVTTGEETLALAVRAAQALRHFAAQDEANAALNLAGVKYRPITRVLAEALAPFRLLLPVAEEEASRIREVLNAEAGLRGVPSS